MKFKLSDVKSDKFVGLLFTEEKHKLFLILAHHYSSDLECYFFNGYSPSYSRIISIATHRIIDGEIIAEETNLEPTDYMDETSIMGRRELIRAPFIL